MDPRAHLLGLPTHIRSQVYSEAGVLYLPRGDSINLGPGENGEDEELQEALACTRSLLFTCRTISEEVSSTVYATNPVYLRYRDQHSLQAIRNLRPASVRSLSDLTILLNASSCIDGFPCCGSTCHDQAFTKRACMDLDQHDQPLQLSSVHGQEVMAEWTETARFLSDHVRPQRLRLHVVCDVADFETAKAVVQPLMAFARLRSCDFRLGRDPRDDLRALAAETAYRATGQAFSQSASPFPFLQLPLELQRQILEYTDLRTPLGEVDWNPKDGYSIQHSCANCAGMHGLPDPDDDSFEHYACQFLTCFHAQRIGCYCSRYHAAFSTLCRCWSPPIALFLVCQSMRDLAQAVFFARNRFVIHATGGDYLAPEKTPPRLEAAIFLSDIVPAHRLSQLKFLELVFPPFEPDYFSAADPAREDWVRTIQSLGAKLTHSKLTLRIYLLDSPNASLATDTRKYLTEEQGGVIQQTYFRLVEPLASLGLTTGLFVHAAWPWFWQKDDRTGLPLAPYPVELEKELERKLEHSVMGDEYDSALAGKQQERDSQWLLHLKGLLALGFGSQ